MITGGLCGVNSKCVTPMTNLQMYTFYCSENKPRYTSTEVGLKKQYGTASFKKTSVALIFSMEFIKNLTSLDKIKVFNFFSPFANLEFVILSIFSFRTLTFFKWREI